MMNNIICSILIFMFGFCANVAFGQNNVIHINVENIKEIKGEIVISIYDKAEAFPKKGKQIFQKKVKVNSNQISVDIEDLPDGDYAIALYHDKNSDGICNLNFFGIPVEGYGFSKNYKPITRAPAFKEVKLSLTKTIFATISLIH